MHLRCFNSRKLPEWLLEESVGLVVICYTYIKEEETETTNNALKTKQFPILSNPVAVGMVFFK